MTKIKFYLPTAHAKQKEILKSESRFRVVVCGRRFGKTTLGQRSILKRAAEYHQACWWLAPTYDMADHVWRDLKHAVRNLPGVHISETDLRMDFPGGGWLAIHSTHNPDHLRGAGLDFVVLDEAAFMPSEVWSQIVRPMLVERKGKALFLSSPNGKNWFYHLYLIAQKSKNAEVADLKLGTLKNWRSFHFRTDENPLLAPDELDAIHAETNERIWHVEYLAEFTDDLGQVFRGIQAAASAPLAAAPIPGRRYVCGLDWGRENDYTAIVVMDAESRAVVALDRFNQVSWALQRGRLKAICDVWQPTVVWAEANSIGSPNIEALLAEGLPVRPFVTTAASKPALIEALSLAIERAEIALLPDEALLGELAAYTIERLPSGGHRYGAPSGLNDDLVIALALAWHAVRFSTISISFA